MPGKKPTPKRSPKKAPRAEPRKAAKKHAPLDAILSAWPATDTYNGSRGRNFSGGWKFHLGEADGAESPAFDDSGWRALDLPHDWSIELPFNPDSPASTGGGYLDGGTGWYRKTFRLPEDKRGKRIFLALDGAYMNSLLWINGARLGERPYGYSSFEYELTPHLREDAPNVLAVRLDNRQPSSRWYSGSGIYRNVWLTALNPVHVEYCGLFVTTPSVEADAATVRVEAEICNQSGERKTVRLCARISNPAGRSAAYGESGEMAIESGATQKVVLEVRVSKPRLWSPESPALYGIDAQVYSGEEAFDSFRTAFGIRTIGMDSENGFLLNRKPLKLNGVCLHHDLGALGAAVNRRAIERQLHIMRGMGCNAVRTSHNPPDPMLLDLCDRLGLLVIDEAFDAWESDNKSAFDYHLHFREWAETDLRAMVRRDRNHPCVVMYSIGNEIPDVKTPEGVEWTRRLRDWARAEDPTRLITHGSNFNEWGTEAADLLDAVGYNYNTHLYDLHHREFPHWKMYASESVSAVRSRGVYKLPTEENLLSGEDLQCSSYDNSVTEWGASAERSWQDVNTRPCIAGEFIWTGFDYLGEPTPYEWPARSSYFGAVDTCGFPKDAYHFYRSKWGKKPMAHILPHWNWEPGKVMPVWVYTNCESAELFLNGKSLGVREFQAGGPLHLEWLVPFEPGVLRAECCTNGRRIAAAERRTAGPPAKIRITPDRRAFCADNADLIFAEVDIIDAAGNLHPAADHRIRFTLAGSARLAGVDNGNAAATDSFRGTSIRAFNGKCLVIVQSLDTPGSMRLTAEADGLRACSVALRSRRAMRG